MQASIVDLRYKMADIKKAIANNEVIAVTDHGLIIADIFPRSNTQRHQAEEQPFFGMLKDHDDMSVDALMDKLRGSRYDAL